MGKVKFLLPEGAEPTQVINNRYSFVDGVMEVSEDDAAKIEPILCGYYGCKRAAAEPVAAEKESGTNTSLAKAATKPASTHTSTAKAA